MVAQMERQEQFSWRCDDCDMAGEVWCEDTLEVFIQMDQHNKEHHKED